MARCIVRLGLIDDLEDRPRNVTAAHAGPRAALQRLDLSGLSRAGRDRWAESARVDAILGSCRLTMKSVRSGMKCWIAFIGARLRCYAVYSYLSSSLLPLLDELRPGSKKYFPPRLEDLMAWSTLFRSAGTWANYCNYVKTGCLIVRASTDVNACAC